MRVKRSWGQQQDSRAGWIRWKLKVTYADRARMIGNALHYKLVRTIFSENMMRKVEMYKVETQRMNGGSCTVANGEVKAPEPGTDEKYLSGLTNEEMETEFRERWEETGGTWTKNGTVDNHGEAEGGTGESEHNYVSGTKEIKIPDAREFEEDNIGGDEGEIKGRNYETGSIRGESMDITVVCRFVKGKGRLDPTTGEEAMRFLTDLRSLNNAISYPGHWNQEMPTLADTKADVPQWAEYYAEEDVSNAFEGMLTVEGQEHLLTVAPPVRLNADSFTDEELRSYGMDEEEIRTLKQSDDWLLQWVGVPQGLASAAPFWNVHIADGFNRMMGENWREYWAQYVDDCLVFAATKEQCRHRQRMLTVALKVLGRRYQARLTEQSGHQEK